MNDIDTLINNIKIKTPLYIEMNINISKELQLLDLQLTAYENLFTSYINKTVEEYNEFNLDKFLYKYTELFIKKINLIKNSIIEAIGYSNYLKINNFQHKCSYQYFDNKLIICKLN